MRITYPVVKPIIGVALSAALFAPALSRAADFDVIPATTGTVVTNILLSAPATYVGGSAPTSINTDVIRFLNIDSNSTLNTINDFAGPLTNNGLVFSHLGNATTNRINSSLTGTSLVFDGASPFIRVTNTLGTAQTNRVFINSPVVLNTNLTISGSLTTNNYQLFFSSNVTGVGGLIIGNFRSSDGNGIIIQGSNDYSGGTIINGNARIQLNTAAAVSNGFGTGPVVMSGNSYIRFQPGVASITTNTFVQAAGVNVLQGQTAAVDRRLARVDLTGGILQTETANSGRWIFDVVNVISNATITNNNPLSIVSLNLPAGTNLNVRGNGLVILSNAPASPTNLAGTISLAQGNPASFGGGFLVVTNDAGALGSSTVNIGSGGRVRLGVAGVPTTNYNLNTDGALLLAVPNARVDAFTNLVDRDVQIEANGGYNNPAALVVSNSGRIFLNGITSTNGISTIEVGRLGVIRGGATELGLLTRGTNLIASPLAIIAGNQLSNVNSIANLGTAADLLLGVTGNTGGSNFVVGTGTAWAGIANERSGGNLTNGTLTVIGSEAYIGAVNANFNLGVTNGTLAIVNSTPGNRANINIVGSGGSVVLNHITTNAALVNHSGVSNFVILNGGILIPNQANAFGEPTITASNKALGVIVEDGGVLNPGGNTFNNALNTEVTVKAGGVLQIDDGPQLQSPVGSVTMESRSVLLLGNVSALTAITQTNNISAVNGLIVRLNANGITNLSTTMNPSTFFEVFGGTRSVNPAEAALNLDGGGIINDTASRTFQMSHVTNGPGGAINVGSSNVTFAAVRGTTLTVQGTNLINGAGNTLNIGTTNQILGRDYDGIVSLANGSTSRFATVNIAPNSTLTLPGGPSTTYQIGQILVGNNATNRIATGLAITNIVLSGGVVDIPVQGNNTRTATIQSISGNGNVVLSAPTNNQVLILGNATSPSLVGNITALPRAGGALTNTATLRKIGSGTNTITGNIDLTSTGLTDIQAGGLILNGTNTGSLNVTNNTFFGGNATILGNVTTFSNAVFAPGNSPGIVSISSNANFNAFTVLKFDLADGGNDQIQVGGDLALGGVLDIFGGATFGGGTYTLFTYGGILSTNGAGLTFGTMSGTALGFNPATDFTIDTTTPGQVNLVVVPEPGTVGLAVMGGVALLGMAIRRRNQK